jgi:hypothetical protein
MIYPDCFDDDDRTWIDGIGTPDCQMLLGYLAVVAWVTPKGERRWRVVTRMDTGPEAALGFLSLAQHKLLDELIYAPDGDDDD